MNFRLVTRSAWSSVTSSISIIVSGFAESAPVIEVSPAGEPERRSRRCRRAAARPRSQPRASPAQAWRPAAEDVVDALTLQPLAPGAEVTRCPRCASVYAGESVRQLLLRNEGRCLVCHSLRVTTRHRRDQG